MTHDPIILQQGNRRAIITGQRVVLSHLTPKGRGDHPLLPVDTDVPMTVAAEWVLEAKLPEVCA